MSKAIKVSVALVLSASLIAAGIVANEGRKEVYYLCGNFSEGVSKKSVIRQLNTLSFSDYKVLAPEQDVNGNKAASSTIYFSSPLIFRLWPCVIHFDAQNKVISAGLHKYK